MLTVAIGQLDCTALHRGTFVTMGAGATTQGEPISDDVYLGKK